MKVPFFDLKVQYSYIKKEIKAAIEEVLDSQWFILGPEVEELEKTLSEYLKVKHTIGVSSGTDALIASLMALEIGAGDEVITTPFTFVATAEAIVRVGAEPVFVDIDAETFNLDYKQIEKVITRYTKAIIPVHCFGRCADMNEIDLIANRYGLGVIEDAAQAIGAKYGDRMAGTMSDLGCFSFFPSKNLGCCGDGGMVVTNNTNLYEKVKSIRNHGRNTSKYEYQVIGGNFRLDAIQAAILNIKFNWLDVLIEKRQNNAKYYDERLESLLYIKIPKANGANCHVYNQYVIRAEKRDALRKFLADNDIGTEIYWPIPLHIQNCFVLIDGCEMPNSMIVADEVLALPIYPELNIKQQEYVVEKIWEFYDEKI